MENLFNFINLTLEAYNNKALVHRADKINSRGNHISVLMEMS